MRVVCVRVPSPIDGLDADVSPWVTLHEEYVVVSLLAESDGRVKLQIITGDRRSLGWFNSVDFITSDGSIPANWVATVGEGGLVELAPAAWLVTGFWEAYYDGDSEAAAAVERELREILAETSR
jgi:hypothetical protein